MAASDLASLLSTLSESVKSASASLCSPEQLAPPSEGISLFDTKNELFLSYLQNLVFLIVIKLRESRQEPQSNGVNGTNGMNGTNGVKGHHASNARSVGGEVVKKLVELRVYLEKGVKPLESRLKYQIDKVVRAADDAAQPVLPNHINGTITKASKPPKSNGFNTHNSGSEFDSDSDGSAVAAAGAGAGANIDPLAYRPNPSAFVRPTPTDTRSAPSDGLYRPPRIAPTSLPTTTNPRESRAARPQKSAALDEFISTELSAAPIAEPSIGSTITAGGRHSKTNAERKEERERMTYEEANYTRLPEMGKKEKAKKRKQMGGRDQGWGGEEWRDLGKGADRVSGLTRGKKGGEKVLEKSRKRDREGGDESGGARMGEQFEKKRRTVDGRVSRRK